MKSSTRLKKNQVIELCQPILDWCIDRYGLLDDVDLDVDYKRPGDPRLFGEYHWNNSTIVVYYNIANTPKLLIETIIHEYTHHQQHQSWYTRYDKKYGYDDNPYEIMAMEREQDWSICFDDILQKNFQNHFVV
jgi:hypothetical protein